MKKPIKVWANKNIYSHQLQYLSNWKDNFTGFFRQRKYRNERANYGVSSKDVWAFDSYFYEMLYNALIIYKKDKNCYPGILTPEEWDNVLDRMIFLCETLMKDESEKSQKLWEEYEKTNYKDNSLQEDWLAAVNVFNEYQTDCRYELMELLKEWLPHIWW